MTEIIEIGAGTSGTETATATGIATAIATGIAAVVALVGGWGSQTPR